MSFPTIIVFAKKICISKAKLLIRDARLLGLKLDGYLEIKKILMLCKGWGAELQTVIILLHKQFFNYAVTKCGRDLQCIIKKRLRSGSLYFLEIENSF